MSKTLLFSILFTILQLTACTYQRGSMNTVLPNASQARPNAAQGLTYLHTGDTPAALAKITQALHQNPTDPMVIDAAGYYFEKTGDIQKANQYYLYAILTSPQSSTATLNYGAFLCRNGYYAESIRYFRKAQNLPYTQGAEVAYGNQKYCSQELKRALGDQAI